ncbi:hypothetical protein MHK_003593, partial [Candidatus Magnetomorum sp. HK-1]
RVGNDGNDNFFEGSIAEIIVYDWAVSPVEHILINNYLSSKYDIALSSNDKYTGDTLTAGDFDLDVAGIGVEGDSTNNMAMSGGLVLIDRFFFSNGGEFFIAGHNKESNTLTVTNLPSNVLVAVEREWMISKISSSLNSSPEVRIGFFFDELGFSYNQMNSSFYVLLKRSGGTGPFDIIDDGGPYCPGEECGVFFNVNTLNLNTGDTITIGCLVDFSMIFNESSTSSRHSLFSDTAIDLTNTSFTIEFWASRF